MDLAFCLYNIVDLHLVELSAIPITLEVIGSHEIDEAQTDHLGLLEAKVEFYGLVINSKAC